MRPSADIDAARRSHARLLATAEAMTDDSPQRPSLLSGWSIGHVLAHLARNADSHTRLLEGVATGEVREQYPTRGMREADIAAGGGRNVGELRRDLTRACEQLELAWDAVPDDSWNLECKLRAGLRPAHELPFRRLREVEVHHADLGLAYSPQDWPDEYVAEELRRRLLTLRDRCDQRALTAWLLNRGPAPDLGPW